MSLSIGRRVDIFGRSPSTPTFVLESWRHQLWNGYSWHLNLALPHCARNYGSLVASPSARARIAEEPTLDLATGHPAAHRVLKVFQAVAAIFVEEVRARGGNEVPSVNEVGVNVENAPGEKTV